MKVICIDIVCDEYSPSIFISPMSAYLVYDKRCFIKLENKLKELL